MGLVRVQLRALLRKNWLLKRRAPVTTAFEVLLPVAFMMLLVIAFQLSSVDEYDEGVYNGQHVDLDGLVQSLGGIAGISTLGSTRFRRGPAGLNSITGLVSIRGSLDALLGGPLPIPTLGQFVGLHGLTRGLTDTVQNDLLSRDNFGSLFGNILTLGVVHLSPDTPAVRALREYLVAQAGGGDEALQVRVHGSEPRAIAYITNATDEIAWALVHFDALSPCSLNYTIRTNYTTVPSTFTIVQFVARGLDTSYTQYLLSGVLTLQRTIHGFVMHLASPGSAEAILAGTPPDGPADAGEPLASATVIPMPTARYSQNTFYRAVGYLLGFFMANSLMYPVSQLTRAIVEEKELRIRQTMRCMGLTYEALVASWLLSGAAQFTLTALLVTIVVCGTFLGRSDPLLVFCYIEAFLLSTVSLALLLSTCFSRAKLAAVGAPMAYVALVIPKFAFFTLDRNERTAAKLASCLLSPSAFAFGADFLADYEYAEVGVTLENAAAEPFSFAACIAMMLIDSVLYLLAALYLDHTLPTQYGNPSHPLFCLPGWLRRAARAGASPSARAALDAELAAEVARAPRPICEAEDVGGGEGTHDAGGTFDGILIDRLVKSYGSGASRKLALKGVTLRIARGRITCLLGHNGAGKTSLISVLTGLYPPTSGDCFVYGHSIVGAREEAYRRLGLCPQHDVLFARLTVAEHAELFAAIKGSAGAGASDARGAAAAGVTKGEREPLLLAPAGAGAGASAAAIVGGHDGVSRARAEAAALLRAVGLWDKIDTQSGALSGGMKRKLGVTIALLAQSSAVLLDEPTSGMDPHSRRATWELLQAAKAERALVLTTHYMDEADLLADKTAILSDGRLQAFGSALFLKRRFGLGYLLTVQLRGADRRAAGDARGLDGALARDAVLAMLRAHVPSAEPLNWAANEASFRLPLEGSAAFPPLLRELDRRSAELGLVGFGLSMTPMDEVFLALAQAEPSQQVRTAAAATVVVGGARAQRGWRARRAPVQDAEPRADGGGGGRAVRDGGGAVRARAPPLPLRFLPVVPCTGSRGVSAAGGSSVRWTGLGARAQSGPAPVPVPALCAAGLSADAQMSEAPAAAVAPRAVAVADAATRREGRAWPHVQLRAMLVKRWICFRRDAKGSFANVIAPVMLVALVQLVLTIDSRSTGPRLALGASLFYGERTQMPFPAAGGRNGSSPEPTTKLAEALLEAARPPAGLDVWEGPGALQLDGLRDSLRTPGSPSRGLLQPVAVPNASTSIDLSRHLLETWDSADARAQPRYVAAAAEDTVQLRLEVSPELELLAAQALLGLSLGCRAQSGELGALGRRGVDALLAALNGSSLVAWVPGARTAMSGLSEQLYNLSELSAAFARSNDTQAEVEAQFGAAATAAAEAAGAMLARALAPGLVAVEAIGDAAGAALVGALLRTARGGATALERAARLLALGDGALGTLLEASRGDELAANALDELLAMAYTSAASTVLPLAGDDLDVVSLSSTLEQACAAFTAALPELSRQGGMSVDGVDFERLVLGAAVAVLAPPVAGLAAAVLAGAGSAGGIVDVADATAALGRALGFSADGLEPLVRGALHLGALLAPGHSIGLREPLRLPDLRLPFSAVRLARVQLEADELRSHEIGGAPGALELVVTNVVMTGELQLASARLPDRASLPAGLLALLSARELEALAGGGGVPLRLSVDEAVVRADVVGTQGFALRGACARAGATAREVCRTLLTAGRDGAAIQRTSAPRARTRNVTVALGVRLSLLHNSSSPHAIGAVHGALHAEQYVRALRAADSVCDAPIYEAGIEPLPRTGRQALQARLVLAVLASIFVLVPFCYVPAAFATFAVRERAGGSTHLQLLSGARRALYWLATYVADMLQYALLVTLALLVLVGYGEPSMVGDRETIGYLCAHMLLYGAAALPQTYAISLAFDSPSSAQISLILVHLVAGFVLVIANLIMLSLERTRDAALRLVWAWRLMPAFNFGEGLLALSQAYYERLLGGRRLALLDAEVLGRPLAFNTALTIGYMSLLLLLDSRHELGRALGRAARCCRPRTRLARLVSRAVAAADEAARARGLVYVEDEDVAAERALVDAAALAHRRRRGRAAAAAAVAGEGGSGAGGGGGGGGGESGGDDEGGRGEHAVLVRGLFKVYAKRGGAAPKLAVRDLSMRVRPRECFGLLGVNGAGKSTTLSILTGVHAPSAGVALVAGHDVTSELARVFSRIGYCPQTDPLLDHLSARETLHLYGALKNMHPRDIASASEALVETLGLSPHAHRPTASYSGGNKRKASLAIALLGSPAVIFLDEPSSGMDPLARRHMWAVLGAEASRRAIVLTSHAMEECEALCHRVAVIAGGRLRALGGLQALKSRFGHGYILELKCEPGRVQSVRAFVADAFGSKARLDEWHGLKLKYLMEPAAAAAAAAVATAAAAADGVARPAAREATGAAVSASDGGQLAWLFELVEKRRAEVGIAEYAASQPTLEQVFLELAREADYEPADGEPLNDELTPRGDCDGAAAEDGGADHGAARATSALGAGADAHAPAHEPSVYAGPMGALAVGQWVGWEDSALSMLRPSPPSSERGDGDAAGAPYVVAAQARV
ncbi:hypothetical protein KFE25_008734 [Diacronema lutheri]|uniref:ABC transporter domain-containing protein n=1 Tax=Diacronema lutheri TaxID=2081491 RepID=A0A8J5XLP3_DIALT|nr:hypothetical protein KFE25_008734 [Diacronema lutheri]